MLAQNANEEPIDWLIRRYTAAKKRHEEWHPVWQECYDYAIPMRDRFDGSPTNGQKLTDRMFDMTAAVSTHRFASRLQAGLTPTFARWSALRAGQDLKKHANPAQIEQIERKLDEVADEVFAAIHRSNFDSQIHEANLDLAVGTASLICDEDPEDLIRFLAVPLTQVCFEAGPDDTIEARFRFRGMTLADIQVEWPRANIGPDLMNRLSGRSEDKLEVVEATWIERGRDMNRFRHVVFLPKEKIAVFETVYEGDGSCPWINFRWSKAAGEVYGRGPLLLALPDIKVANATVELVLANADLAITGMWQGEDDGVLNPSTLRPASGTVIPIAPGSSGLKPLETPGRFDVAALVLEDLRNNIKRALYDETLGPPTGTPMSATEVSERMADLYRSMGSSYGRLQRELVQPIIRRVIYILRKAGRIQLPRVDGRLLQIVSQSPLSSAQAQEDVLKFQQFTAVMANTFGPERMALTVNPGEAGDWLAKQFSVSKRLLYTGAERDAHTRALQQLSRQAASSGAGAGGMVA